MWQCGVTTGNFFDVPQLFYRSYAFSHTHTTHTHTHTHTHTQFPYCDGSHNAHNKDTGDNVGPLKINKAEKTGGKKEQKKDK